MSVTPSAPLRTIISSEDYTLALKWWLGLPLFHGPEEERTCPGCGRPCDLFGDHLVCCARNNFSRWHNVVQEAIANLLQASGPGFIGSRLRSLRQHELLESLGLALMRQVWRLLANKNHLFH